MLDRRLLVVVALVCAAPSVALAHKMKLKATLAADRPEVVVEVSFEGDELAEGANVAITDSTGRVIGEGATDEKGIRTFPRPPGGTYTVTATDDFGHRVSLSLTVPEDTDTGAVVQTESHNRLLMTAVGLAVIGAGTLLVWLLIRRKSR